MDAALIASVRAKAEILGAAPLGERGDALTAMALERAMAHCQRSDVPEEMEQAVAAVVVAMAQGDTVKSLTRGDTAMSFETENPLSVLAPFRRLRGVKREAKA